MCVCVCVCVCVFVSVGVFVCVYVSVCVCVSIYTILTVTGICSNEYIIYNQDFFHKKLDNRYAFYMVK